MSKYFCVIEISATPKIVRKLNYIVQGTAVNDNTDDINSWSKNSRTMDRPRDVERFVCENNAQMNSWYIKDWTPSTSRGDYTNYSAEMLECLLGIYLSEFQNPNGAGVTGDYQLDVSDPSNASIDIANSPNANAIKDLFVANNFVFSVKSL